MTANKPKWTAHQNLAITTADKDVLVTASAGTGKTAVLSARCVKLLIDSSDPTDISQVLVLTFTDAAAAEMTSRIEQNLREKFYSEKHGRIWRQILGLDAADISTIHSFCKRTVTEYFYKLDIDPAFRIIDSDEQTLLKSDVLNKTIEHAWNDHSLVEGLSDLLYRRNLTGRRGDFLDRIIKISEFLDGIAHKENWYQRAAALTEAAADSKTALAEEQKNILIEKLSECISRCEYAVCLDQKFAAGLWKEHIEKNYIHVLQQCVKYLNENKTDDCSAILTNFRPPNFSRKPGDLAESDVDLIKAPVIQTKEIIKKLTALALLNSSYQKLIEPLVDSQTKIMIELVSRFDRNYTTAKAKLNALDFADLEHLMLKLLTENQDIASSLRRKYKYIFVDEYQDINAVQQAVIDKLSSADNLFVVGDVKQSIYGFRQSKPEIFLENLRRASEKPDSNFPALRVDLSDNFRSRKGVLDFANLLFSRIMKPAVCSIEYDKKAFLKPAFDYQPTDQKSPQVEIFICDQAEDENENNENENTSEDFFSPAQRQAALIADRIKQLVNTAGDNPKLKVYDKKSDSYRNITCGDIVILMRSLGSANAYVEMLRLAGIPVSSQSSAGYFAAVEITDCLSLLKILDNPRRDIELAATLRSALFSVTDTQLAQIRAFAETHENKQKFDLYDCLLHYSQKGPDQKLRQKLTDILTTLDSWRTLGRRESLADLIWKIYRQTGYLSFVSALPNGTQRTANLLKLHDRAIQFEGFLGVTVTTSLTGFVEFVEDLLEKGGDWAPAQPEAGDTNAVRIMSVHRSKGLEFPVVFLAELNHKFNISDMTGDCLVDESAGLGLQITHTGSKQKVTSLAHEVIAEKKRRQMLAEEMRILYVALTRAREKLILTASKDSAACAKTLQSLIPLAAKPLTDWQLNSADRHLDWLLMGLANQKKLLDAFALDSTDAEDTSLFTVDIIPRTQLNDIARTIVRRKDDKTKKLNKKSRTAAVDKTLVDKIADSLNWQYPFQQCTIIPAKTSVSELIHSADEFKKSDLSTSLTKKPRLVHDTAPQTNAALIGTATHLTIKHLPLTKELSPDIIRATIDKLSADGLIEPNIAKLIDVDSITKFFHTETGLLALSPENKILREWPFTWSLNIENSTSGIIVQGIVDMIIDTPRGLVVIDFKTDRIAPDQINDRAELYTPQLALYARAAGDILKKALNSAILHFLAPNRSVTIDTAPKLDFDFLKRL